jgi:hypothetical protein
MTTRCPSCGQRLPLCPVCHNPVRAVNGVAGSIARHLDKAEKDCQGAGLPYRTTITPTATGKVR